MQFRNAIQAHQSLGDLLPALHVWQQIRATSERHRLGTFAVQNARGLRKGLRSAKLE